MSIIHQQFNIFTTRFRIYTICLFNFEASLKYFGWVTGFQINKCMTQKASLFLERINRISNTIDVLKSRYNTLSFFRILVFVLFLIFAILSLKDESVGGLLLSIILFLILFIFLVRKHNKINRSKILNQELLEINREEVKRIQFKFDGICDGEDYVNDTHPYISDLDIFGRNSIFQLLNRAGTDHGVELVRAWLENPAKIETILTRQNAVKELVPLLEWRQKIQAYGRTKSKKKENESSFYEWLAGKDFIRKRRLYLVIPYVATIFSLTIISAVIFGLFSFYYLLSPLVLTGYFLIKVHDYSRTTFDMTQNGVRILAAVENIIFLIENQKFKHPHLLQLQLSVMMKNEKASQKIKALKNILEWLMQRGNQMYHLFNSFFLLDYLLLEKAELWRSRYKQEIAVWFDTIAEIEALNSLAAFTFINDSYAFPKIVKDPYLLRCTDLGHPLIPDDARVNNDFYFSGKGNTCVITGSNMAGKSTFLRTVGVNAVLAFTGAPVCAESFEISLFQVFTSMRTKDNLEENISSFYAELLRLKMLFQQIRQMKPVLYLLDEILKGTNSVDRHLGAESLILQLNEMNAFGLVSTHDLKLGELQKSNNQISNYNFSSSIIDEEIVFDYKLRKGICESTNASQLMAKIGIKLKS